MVNRYDLYLKVCPFCGHDHLIRWGYYKRYTLPLPGVIRIQRIRCMNCGHTTNVLPSFLLAHKSYQVNALQELVSQVIKQPMDWKKSPDIVIDLSTAYRWLRRLKQQALQSLPTIRNILLTIKPDHPVMDATDVQPEPLVAINVILKRFLSLAEQLFTAALCLVDTHAPENDDLFCFLNHFLAKETGRALLLG